MMKIERFAFIHYVCKTIHVLAISIFERGNRFGTVIVGLMTDEAISGYNIYPVTSLKNRASVVECLKMVDYVYPLIYTIKTVV